MNNQQHTSHPFFTTPFCKVCQRIDNTHPTPSLSLPSLSLPSLPLPSPSLSLPSLSLPSLSLYPPSLSLPSLPLSFPYLKRTTKHIFHFFFRSIFQQFF